MALATATKGSSTISEYFTRMKALVDEMASAGKRLEDDELVSYILTGIDLDYDLVVSAVTARMEQITVGELLIQLTSHEQRMELRNNTNNPSANMAAKGGRGGNSNNSRSVVVAAAEGSDVASRRVDAAVEAAEATYHPWRLLSAVYQGGTLGGKLL
jgi:hypothetical protein